MTAKYRKRNLGIPAPLISDKTMIPVDANLIKNYKRRLEFDYGEKVTNKMVGTAIEEWLEENLER